MKTYFKGDKTKNRRVFVEKFVPRDHSSLRNQVSEYKFIDKALRMCYETSEFSPSQSYNHSPNKGFRVQGKTRQYTTN